MTELSANDVSVSAGPASILDRASLAVRSGELVAVLGPNGAGKTTLLRALLGLASATGQVTLDGIPVRRLSAAARARRIAYLPQSRPLAWPSPCATSWHWVAMPGARRRGACRRPTRCAVDAALEACDLAALAGRATDSLSGGELARVHLARAFAANAELLLADEPVAALDPRHQLRIASRLRQFVDGGGGALVVLHEVALAARIADRLVFMRDGRIVSDGPPSTVSPELLADVYGVKRARRDRRARHRHTHRDGVVTARALMIQGTGSDVGKSVLVAGLCRAARRRGIDVAPFKPQNMSNNAAVCAGGEIGRAQALQALAAGLEPIVDHNPVLLKPESDRVAQVVVHGRVHASLAARRFHRRARLAHAGGHAELRAAGRAARTHPGRGRGQPGRNEPAPP